MQGERYTDLGELIDACYKGALVAYRNEYASHVRVEDLYANHVRTTRIASNLYADGVVDIMVKIIAVRPSATELYFWKAHQVAGKYYVL
jgi:hypothetical protein